MTRPPLLFLSGAGLPAFVWDEVRERLDTESRVVASPGPEGTLASYAAAAVRTAEGWPAFHVVAHSLGGTVAAAVVAAEPTRVTRVTGVAAVVPPPGSSYVGALPFPARLVAGVLVRTVGTRPPASVLRAMCAGLSEEDTERVVAGFSPEGRRVYLDRTPPRSWPPASYVVTTHDREFQPQVQERYAAELGAPTHTLRTGHLPMLERPDELAALLDQAS